MSNNNFQLRSDEIILIKKSSFQKKLSGFTLVELIVVISILVILGTIAFINLGGVKLNQVV